MGRVQDMKERRAGTDQPRPHLWEQTEMNLINVILKRKSRAQHGMYKLVITLTKLDIYLSTKMRNKFQGIK